MVNRVYVEKKPGFDIEARALQKDIVSFLGVKALTGLRLLNRYDVENLSGEAFERAVKTVFSEPQLDDAVFSLPAHDGLFVFATEYLPGQFDQRADSAAQCVQLMTRGERPDVRTAQVYFLEGDLTEADVEKITRYVINPVEKREASLDRPSTLKTEHPAPGAVENVTGFLDLTHESVKALRAKYGLAMDENDLLLCRDYFASEGREPTFTELRVIDTYWSDHCRHTTFLTHITGATFDDPEAQKAYERYLDIRKALGREEKPITLMDIGTIGAKYCKSLGKLDDLDESKEINACTVKIDVDVDGETQPWLLLFKNETHNHPTEIEPFGGAATCIGGAIRDPLSGRGYVYQAMRVTGAADPTLPVESTLPGKLPQRKLTTTAAAGYSSYGNQIGLSTGLVDEIYHPGYAAKRLEIGAVVGAAPASHVRRLEPEPGDQVILLGGRTGRDGCGGATGSSKAHTKASLSTCGAEVQKGNAPEERKLQRLFRDARAASLIKRCNDFGAGGVSVAIGELADGLLIDLDKVPVKYEGLGGTELAISESQERMAVVLAPGDVPEFLALAASENLEATVVATVTEEPRLTMTWRGEKIADIARAFLDSNGAPKSAQARVTAPEAPDAKPSGGDVKARLRQIAADLNVCSKRGLGERFDGTIGAGSVLMPFGGARQKTPAQAMAALLPVLSGHTQTCSVMAFGGNPYEMEKSPFRGAYLAVVESVARLVASGAGGGKIRLTFQEYFERMTDDPARWGKPLAALLGALCAQVDLDAPAIGGKDSMSGSFEKLDVPPTLVSFAVTTANAKTLISPELKRAGFRVCLLAPKMLDSGLPEAASLLANFDRVTRGIRAGEIVSAMVPGFGGVAGALLKMCLGNRVGFEAAANAPDLFTSVPGSMILEMAESAPEIGVTIGRTIGAYTLLGVSMDELESVYENRLEGVFPSRAPGEGAAPAFAFEGKNRPAPRVKIARPRVLIPVFPGTNCEYDSRRAFEKAGADVDVMVVNNLSARAVEDSASAFAKALSQSQIVFIPGGFSGGDEPDGSGKFITAFFRNPLIAQEIMALLQKRDGLIGGICNGFQALVKLGLLPYGEIRDTKASDPTLTYNVIGRHQSLLVRARVASTQSPWLAYAHVGDVELLPVSHGEGRFIASEETIRALAQNGQIATQYANASGAPSMDIDANPNGSAFAVEGVTSPDGRVFGRMAHAERTGECLYRNVPGDKASGMFQSAVAYFG